MNECCLNFLGVSIATEEGSAFSRKVMTFMREVMAEFQEETGNIYNLEATPAESTAYRFARIDTQRYPDIITANQQARTERGAKPYYTNSTHLPVGYSDDIYEVLESRTRCRHFIRAVRCSISLPGNTRCRPNRPNGSCVR